MKRFRCNGCGYEIKRDSLKETFICPICRVGKEDFELVEDPTKEEKRIRIDEDNPSIMRIMEKCTNCGNCKRTCEQIVGIKQPIKERRHTICINCGQCSQTCPTGAIVPKYSYHHVIEALKDKNKTVIVSTAPAVRVALGENFNMEPGTFVEKKMVGALKQLGFDYILDITFGADLTIMEEASELVDRMKHKELLPQFTSCCPSWVKYVEIYYPEMLPYLSSCKSPIAMQGSIVKSYFSQIHELDPRNVVHVVVAPCTAKKQECLRKELNYTETFNDVDYVLTTSELALWMKEQNIDLKQVKESNFDSLMQKGSGSGLMFGNSGGVMESALRNVHYLLTHENQPESLLNLEAVRGLDNVKESIVTINNQQLKVAVVYGIPNVIPIIENIKRGKVDYDFIEVMNCPGGCIGGGGQPLNPLNKKQEILEKRMERIYQDDVSNKIRSCHENEDIKRLYQYYLKEPLSKDSERFLHTYFTSKKED